MQFTLKMETGRPSETALTNKLIALCETPQNRPPFVQGPAHKREHLQGFHPSR